MKHTDTITTAVAGLIAALAFTTTAAQAANEAPAAATEKCYGVSKAGKNDCQTSMSACAGTSKKDGNKDAWLAVPKGTCEKLVGGMLKASK